MDIIWLVLIVLLAILALVSISGIILLVNKQRLPPACEFVEAGGVKLHYCRKGSGPPVVLVHGSNGSFIDFRLSVVEELSKDFGTIAFDRPGHGFSQRQTSAQKSCAVHGDLIREAWKNLGVVRPVLVGHSSAGAVLMDIAVRNPQDISGIVLISGVVHSFEGQKVPVMGLYGALKRKYVGTALIWTVFLPIGGLIGRWLLKFTFAPDPVPPQYRRMGIALALRPSALKAEAEDLECLEPTLKAIEGRYPEVRLPMVIVYGAEDRSVPPEGQSVRLHSEVPGSELIRLPETGHLPMFTRPRDVEAAVRRAWELAGTTIGARLK